MPRRRLAHIGSRIRSTGVAVTGVRAPVFRVRGLPAGLTVFAVIYRGEQALSSVVCEKDGNYKLAEGDWLEVVASALCRELVCDIIEGKAA